MSDTIRRLLIEHIVDQAQADGVTDMPRIAVTVDQLIGLARADAKLATRGAKRRRRRRGGPA